MTVLRHLRPFHLPQQIHDFGGGVSLHFAAQKVVDVKDELLAPRLVGEVVLGDLNEVANGVDHYFVGRLLHRAFEEEIVGNFGLGPHELQKGLRSEEVGTGFEEVLGPLHEDAPHCAGVELGDAVLDDLRDLGTGERVGAEDLFHILFEGVLQLDGLPQQQTHVLVNGLNVDVGWVDVGLRGEVLQQIHRRLSAGHFGEVDLLSLSRLRVSVLQPLEDVEQSVVRKLQEVKYAFTSMLTK